MPLGALDAQEQAVISYSSHREDYPTTIMTAFSLVTASLRRIASRSLLSSYASQQLL